MILSNNLISEDLLNFISRKSRIPKAEIKINTEIYNSGIITSLALLELMSYIEQKYNILINPEELIEDNFKNIMILTQFINNKLEAK